MTYFGGSELALIVCSYALVVLFHVFVVLLIVRIASNRKNCAFFEWILSLAFPLASSIVLTIFSTLSLYLLNLHFSSDQFSSYKQISSSLIQPSGYNYIVLTTCISLTTVECLSLAFAYAILRQERILSLWCTCNWQQEMVGLATKLAIFSAEMLDPQDSCQAFTSACVSLLLAGEAAFRFSAPLPRFPVGELAELFYCAGHSMVQLLAAATSKVSDDYRAGVEHRIGETRGLVPVRARGPNIRGRTLLDPNDPSYSLRRNRGGPV